MSTEETFGFAVFTGGWLVTIAGVAIGFGAAAALIGIGVSVMIFGFILAAE